MKYSCFSELNGLLDNETSYNQIINNTNNSRSIYFKYCRFIKYAIYLPKYAW